jgi:hypothetical protein
MRVLDFVLDLLFMICYTVVLYMNIETVDKNIAFFRQLKYGGHV